jgi:HSP20 family molecular chaperone IbpA
MPEEIVASKVAAKMDNGLLLVQVPKRTPTRPQEETQKVEVN